MAEHCPYKLVPHRPEARYGSPHPVEGPDGAVYGFNDEYDARKFVHDMNHAYTLGWRAGAREPAPGSRRRRLLREARARLGEEMNGCKS